KSNDQLRPQSRNPLEGSEPYHCDREDRSSNPWRLLELAHKKCRLPDGAGCLAYGNTWSQTRMIPGTEPTQGTCRIQGPRAISHLWLLPIGQPYQTAVTDPDPQ